MSAIKLYSSMGIHVELNSTELLEVASIGDIGGEPNLIDVTCLLDTVQKNIHGVQQVGNFAITYLRNATDNATVDAAVTASKTAPVPIVITFPDNSTASNTCEVSSMINGLGVDDRIEGVANCALQGDWVFGTVTP